MRSIILSLLLFIFAANAQTISWSEVSSDYQLPEGMKVFKGERSYPKLKIYYFDVDLNVDDIMVRPYITTSPAMCKTLVQRFGAYAAINGGFFGGSSSYSSVVYPNEVKAMNVGALTRDGKTYPVIRSLFGVHGDRSMSVNWIYHYGGQVEDIYTFDEPMDYGNNDPNPKPTPNKSNGTPIENLLVGIGGAPTLVKDGQVEVTYNEEIMWGSGVGLTNRDPRTAIGYTADNHVIMLVADGRHTTSEGVSLGELAEIMINLGCVEAMNLDGGGSTQMAIGDQTVNIQSTRGLPTIMAVVHKDSLHLPKEPQFEKVIDTEYADVTLNGDGWFETANAGYFGETKSMLNEVGTGESYAEYFVKLPGKAKYEVYAWWVASSNRCTNTPYIINHFNGVDTVRVDQTKGNASWQLIGEYEFSTDETESIVISDAGSGSSGTFVVADAIKLVAYESVTAVEDTDNHTPDAFALSNAFPNPFNPSTRINFSVKEDVHVSIQVFDVLGRLVATPVEQFHKSGEYSLMFDATELTGGIYFYRMTAGSFAETKRMVLLK